LVRLPLASPLSLFLGTQFPASAFSFVFFTLQPLTFNPQLSPPDNPFPFIHLFLFLDKYRTSVVTSFLIVTRHARRSAPFPAALGSLGCPFSCLPPALNCQLSTSPSPKFFPLIPFADPPSLTSFGSYRYENRGGEGPSQHTVSLKFFLCHRFENSPVSPAVATDPKTPYRKSFACHTSETPGPVAPTYFQKRLRPSRSDGGSCEKGAPSSGEKIESTALQSPKSD